MFWFIRTIIFLGLWLILADWKRWREIIPVCILASLIDALTDVTMHHYELWSYDGRTVVNRPSKELNLFPDYHHRSYVTSIVRTKGSIRDYKVKLLK